MRAFYTLPDKDLKIPSAALRISGPDANTYLQGQFTQDVRIEIGKKVYGLWLNQKGKVLADSHILRSGSEAYLVFAPRSDAGVLRGRLEAYLIADEVEIADVTTDYVAITLWTDGTDDLTLAKPVCGDAWPQADSFVSCEGALIFPSQAKGGPTFTVLVAPAELDAWVARCSRAGFRAASWAEAERARIAAAVPAVPDDIGPSDLPNEGGLDRTAISYAKGCYLGQEVMSRLKNLGQVRRQLRVIRGPGLPPPRGSELFQGEQRVGEVRSAAPEGGGFIAFAMLSLVTLQPGLPLARVAGGEANLTLDHG